MPSSNSECLGHVCQPHSRTLSFFLWNNFSSEWDTQEHWALGREHSWCCKLMWRLRGVGKDMNGLTQDGYWAPQLCTAKGQCWYGCSWSMGVTNCFLIDASSTEQTWSKSHGQQEELRIVLPNDRIIKLPSKALCLYHALCSSWHWSEKLVPVGSSQSTEP